MSGMERRAVWCLALVLLGLAPAHTAGPLTVLIDGYTHSSTLTSGDSVPLGTQVLLVCQVVGLPYGTPLSYTWTCPNEPCEVEGYYGREIYNEHILAVNTTSTSDGGAYTCQVTATGGQEATGSFTLTVTNGDIVHSYGRLIPHEFPITDLQQISGPNGIGRITCTVSSGTARFIANGGDVEGGGVTETRNGATATLVVNPSTVSSFRNRQLYCTNINTNFFFLFTSSANLISVPSLKVGRVKNSVVEYQVQRNDNITSAVTTGYEVTHFGVPMIGEYMNTGRGRRVTISPAVPGAQYRITAWALGGGNRSETPAVEYATTGEERPSDPRELSITRILEAEIELSWLPPAEPNGKVHYVIYYTPEDGNGTEQSKTTGSGLTHYNLTGLERNRVYTNIAVQAVNSVGMSDRSAVIAQYNHTPPVTDTAGTSPSPQTALVAGVVVALLVVVVLLSLAGMVVAVVVVVRRRNRRKKEVENVKVAEAYKLYKNKEELQGKGSPDGTETIRSRDEVHKPVDPDHYNLKPGQDELTYANTGPSSNPTRFDADMYSTPHYSEVDQVPSGTQRDRGFEPTSGGKWGHYEDFSYEVKNGVNKDFRYAEPDTTTEEKMKEEVNENKDKMVPVCQEHFYAQPDMAKKRNKKTQQQQGMEGVSEDSTAASNPKEEIVPVCPEQFYAQPDMAKKRNKRDQQQEQEEVSEDSKAAPPPPPPYKKALQEREEAVDALP